MERTTQVINILVFALAFLSITIIGCASTPPVAAPEYTQSSVAAPAPVVAAAPVSTGTAELDRTIKMASDDINAELPSGSKVALLYFNSAADAFSDYVIEEMSVHLVRGKKLVVVDRKEIDLIRNEMEFQMSGEVSDESIQKIGKKLGAQFIISGSLASLGDSYRFRTKVINVNSAAVETSLSAVLNDSPQIRHLLGQGKTSVPQTTAAKEIVSSAAVTVQTVPGTDSTVASSKTESPDLFCEEQRKIAAGKFANSRKNKTNTKALLTEAVDALDKCLARTPSADMRRKVTQNREVISKELKVANGEFVE